MESPSQEKLVLEAETRRSEPGSDELTGSRSSTRRYRGRGLKRGLQLSLGAKLQLAFCAIVGLFFCTQIVVEHGFATIERSTQTVEEQALPLMIGSISFLERISVPLSEIRSIENAASLRELNASRARAQLGMAEPRKWLLELSARLPEPALSGLSEHLDKLDTELTEAASLGENRIRSATRVDELTGVSIDSMVAAFERLDTALLELDPGASEVRRNALGELRMRSMVVPQLVGRLDGATTTEEAASLRNQLQVEARAFARELTRIETEDGRAELAQQLNQFIEATLDPSGALDQQLLVIDATARGAHVERWVDHAASELRRDMRELIQRAETELAIAARKSHQSSARARVLGRTLFLGALALALLVVTFYVRGSVVRRIKALSTSITRLSEGELDVAVESEGSDELAQLAGATEVFRANARQLHSLTAKLQTQNEELQQFAYVASHDLKSPLRAVETLASFIEEDCGPELPAESREHLTLLRNRVRKMESLLEDLLRYNRLGSREEMAEIVDPQKLVEESAELREESSTYEISIEGNPGWIRIARAPFELVVRNLIGNAIQHHDRDEGRIRVCLSMEGPHELVVNVIDDGPGIPSDQHDAVFTMFRSLSATTAGSGMGMALVRKAARTAGGSVEIIPRDGRGAHICVRFPIVPEPSAALPETERVRVA